MSSRMGPNDVLCVDVGDVTLWASLSACLTKGQRWGWCKLLKPHVAVEKEGAVLIVYWLWTPTMWEDLINWQSYMLLLLDMFFCGDTWVEGTSFMHFDHWISLDITRPCRICLRIQALNIYSSIASKCIFFRRNVYIWSILMAIQELAWKSKILRLCRRQWRLNPEDLIFGTFGHHGLWPMCWDCGQPGPWQDGPCGGGDWWWWYTAFWTKWSCSWYSGTVRNQNNFGHGIVVSFV